ncbi:hypothetical protein LUZ60_005200 [Juncus effusus]|nr:hypothetical protein LUZ60_005200 [Juncus effusus]
MRASIKILKRSRDSLMLHSHLSPLHSSSISSRVSAVAMSKTVQEQKKAVRSDIRRTLKALSPSQRSEQDLAVQNAILNSAWFKSSKRVCAYISCESLREVDTSKILAEILTSSDSESKELYVPRVEDKNSNMRMFKITTMNDLVANSMNILEPSPLDDEGNQREDVMSASHPIDLFLLPGVAFDKQGRRLGRGGGYYDVLLKKYQDRALEKNWNKPLLVALAYSAQIMEENIIPMTPNDIPIDAIVSPNEIIPISSNAKDIIC